jgi:membrane-bound lytic murein transglycosylase D
MISQILKYFCFVTLILVGFSGCSDLAGSTSSSPATSSKHSRDRVVRYASHRVTSRYRSSLIGGMVGQTSLAVADLPALDATDGNFWDHLRSDFQLPSYANEPQVQNQISWFMHNQGYLDRTINRAAPYMYYILQQTEQRHLPGELVLLPVLESAYNPFAYNRSGATGMWQLMRGTASGFGVKQNFWFDGRRDIYASTNAALDYLTYLQSYFSGNWLYAVGAYDTGEGNIEMAVRRNEARGDDTDFWDLPLAAETRAYVPRLLALACIIRDPARYGITLPAIGNHPYLAQVDVGAPINLSRAAKMAGMSLPELKELNPGYNHTTTDPNGPYTLILPIDRVSYFKQELGMVHDSSKGEWGRYRVQRGDTLQTIAQRFNTSVATLRQEDHLGSNAPVGRVIMVPTGKLTSAPQYNNTVYITTRHSVSTEPATVLAENTISSQIGGETRSDFSSAPQLIAKQKTHTVKKGDTLASIAKHNGISIHQLEHWNHIRNSKSLRPGAKVIVGYHTVSSKVHQSSKTHVKVKPHSVKTVNGQHTHATPAPAHTTKPTHAVSSAVHSKSSKASTVRHYTVHHGDTLKKIARRNGVSVSQLLRWNHVRPSALQPGEKLAIHSH